MKAFKIYSIIFVFTLFFASCAKKEAPGTPQDVVVGTWQLYQTATDDNNNHILDDQELRTLATGDKETYVFYRNYSGQQTVNYFGALSTYALSWALFEGSRYMQIVKLGRDTQNYVVVKFSPIDLTLLDTVGTTYSWYILKKQ